MDPHAEPASPRRSRIRWRRVLAGLTLAGALVVAGGWFPQEPLRRAAEGALRRATSPASRLGRLKLVPGLLRADIEGLEVRGDGYTLLVRRVHARIAARTLWTRGIALQRLEVDGLRAEVAASAGADDRSVAASAPLAALGAIYIENASLRDAGLRWVLPGGAALQLEGLSGGGSIGAGRFELTAGKGTWRSAGGRVVSVGPARAQLDMGPGLDVSLASLEIQAGRSRAHGHGPLLRAALLRPELELRAELDLAELAQRSGSAPLAGRVTLRGRLSRPAGAWRAEARVEGDVGGRVEGTASLQGDRTEGQLALRGGALEALWAAGRLRGPVDLRVAWRGSLDSALDVEARLEAKPRAEPWHARVSATARGQVRPRERSLALRWEAEGQGASSGTGGPELRLTAEGTAVGPLPPRISGQLEGTLGWTGPAGPSEAQLAGILDAVGDHAGLDIEARSASGVVRGRATVAGGAGELVLRSERLRLEPLVAGLSGEATIDLRASGPMRQPVLALEASASDLGWHGTSLGGLRAHARGSLARLAFDLALPELAVTSTGEVGVVPGARLRGRARLEGAPLERLSALAVAAGLGPLAGAITTEIVYDVDPGRPAAATIEAAVSELLLAQRGVALRAGPFRAALASGRLTLDGLALEGPGLQLSAEGNAGLGAQDPLDLRTRLDVDLAALRLPGRQAPAASPSVAGQSAAGPEGGGRAASTWLSDLQGRLSADVTLGGSRARPELLGRVSASGVAGRMRSGPGFRIDAAEALLQGDRLTLGGVEAHVGQGRANLSGAIPFASVLPALRGGRPLAPGQEAKLALAWSGIDVAPFDAPLSGQLTVDGGLGSIAEPRARLLLESTRLRLEGVPIELPETTLSLDSGRLVAESLTLRGPAGDLQVSGFADLARRTLDLAGRGRLDLRPLSGLLTDTALGGSADVDVRLAGPPAAPQVTGSLRVGDGSLRLRSLPQAVTGIAGSVTFTTAGAEIDATGSLGGGALRAQGSLALGGHGRGETRLALTGHDIGLRYPPGMRSRLDAKLILGGRPGSLTLAGTVDVQRGLYELDTALEAALRAARARATESAKLRSIGLDVELRTARPLSVRSSLGELEAQGQLSLRGDMQEPLPYGRLQVRPGGKLELQGRAFRVEGGALNYAGSWNAEIALRAEAAIRAESGERGENEEHRVVVRVSGSLEEPQLALSAEPELSQDEIVRLVVTGRGRGALDARAPAPSSSEGLDAGATLIGGGAGTLLAARLTSGMARAVGLDQFSIRPDLLPRERDATSGQPSLVATELDPSARFTFGKDFDRHLGLVYSAGLGGAEDRFVQVEGRPGHDVTLRFQRTDAGTYTLGAGQRFRWGAGDRQERIEDRRVLLSEVRLEGDPLPAGLSRRVGLAKGKRVTPWQVQEKAERLRDRLRERRYLEAEVAARLEGTIAIVSVTAGPRFEWRVEGLAGAPDLGPLLGQALAEEDALERGRERLLRELHARGHWRAAVEMTAEARPEGRMLVFTATPGPRYDRVDVRFEGTRALRQRELLEAAGGVAALVERPQQAVAALTDAYRARRHLAARVALPRVEDVGQRLSVVVVVEEGPAARLAGVRFEGATLPPAELTKAVRLAGGTPFSEVAVAKAVAALRALYLSRGYASVRVRPRLLPRGEDLDLVVEITEGSRQQIESIVLAGNTRTRDALVRRALRLRPGRPLDPRALTRAEQRLYDLGVFSRVAIVPRDGSPGTLEVQLEEGPLFSAGYDLRWSRGERASGLVEAELRNLFGTGLALGARQRLGGDLRETRGSLHLPSLLAAGDVTGSVFRTDQDIPGGITRLTRGFQVQQSLRLRGLEIYAGYRYRRNTTRAAELIGLPIDIAGLDLSLVKSTRDNLLDPTEGRFLAVNLELDPALLGSDAPFVKGFAQLSVARSFAARSLTWAQGVRLGLARATGGEPLLPSERFTAGGANSLRGFGTNEVGPRDREGIPLGGDAVLVVNQELRYRHPSGIGAALFYDGGNIYSRAGDMGFGLRHSVGAGLRWTSPVGLLRLDAGFPIDRQPGEKSYRLYFSLGQAF